MAVIKDVANLAGVSISTVSKYLNNPSALSEPYRELVEKAVKELNYTPSETARGLRTKKSNSIALIVPDITNPFYSEMYNSIRNAAMHKGYTVQLYTSEENIHAFSDLLRQFTRSNIDGIIVCFLDEHEVTSELSQTDMKTPIALASWNIDNPFNSVILDVQSTVYTITKYLIDKGHKDIAYIGGTVGSIVSVQKFSGFQRAMNEAGLPVRDEFTYEGNYLFRTGFAGASKFMQQSERPTAIVCANDIIAVGCCKYLVNNGCRIPEDVAVTGMDGIQLSRVYDPSITTMAMPTDEMCQELVSMLITKINHPGSRNRQSIYTSRLSVGRSTDAQAPIYLDF